MLLRFISVLAAGAMFTMPLTAAEPVWPTKAVTVLVPFAAGGTSDIIARTIGQKLSVALDKSFIVDNRGGAGGTIAASLLARAPPDGQLLMLTHIGLVFNASLYDKLPYDTLNDIAPVAYVGATPNVLVVNKALPVNSVEDFLALARSKPFSISYGSGGVGSAGHLPMEVLQSVTGIKLQHVPYKGSGPAIVDLIGGQIQAMLLTIPAVMPYITDGSLRAIATSGSRRSPALPNLPTLAEAGVPGFDYAPWYGVFAPARTPPEIIEKIHDAVNKVLADPEVRDKLAREGLEVELRTRGAFVALVKSDMEKWSRVIKTVGIKAN